MASLIGEQHEVQVSAELGRQNAQHPTLPKRSGISSDSNDGKDNGGCSKGKEGKGEQRKNNHVKKTKITVSSQWLSGEKRIIYSPPRERPLTRGCGEQTNMATWMRESGGSLPGSRLNSKSVYTACQQCLEQHKARRGDKEHFSWPRCPTPSTTATATIADAIVQGDVRTSGAQSRL